MYFHRPSPRSILPAEYGGGPCKREQMLGELISCAGSPTVEWGDHTKRGRACTAGCPREGSCRVKNRYFKGAHGSTFQRVPCRHLPRPIVNSPGSSPCTSPCLPTWLSPAPPPLQNGRAVAGRLQEEKWTQGTGQQRSSYHSLAFPLRTWLLFIVRSPMRKKEAET